MELKTENKDLLTARLPSPAVRAPNLGPRATEPPGSGLKARAPGPAQLASSWLSGRRSVHAQSKQGVPTAALGLPPPTPSGGTPGPRWTLGPRSGTQARVLARV